MKGIDAARRADFLVSIIRLRECFVSYSFLDGIRVLDLSQYVPGPCAAQLLADMGAEVVRIEPPGGGPMRRFGPLDADGISAWYKVVNG